MKIAVIETGGKQYLVKENDQIKIDPIKKVEDTKNINFQNVLLYADEENFLIGQPKLENVSVIGELLRENKKKIKILKYKPKTRYRKKKGYKIFTWLVEIKEIKLK